MHGDARLVQCEVIDRDAQSTLVVRTRTQVQDLPEVMGETYGVIFQYLGELGEEPAGAPFVAYHNMDMQDLDVEIGVPVRTTLNGKGDVTACEIPAGQYATCIHVGPYSELKATYASLSNWIQENGYAVTGIAYEIYLNDPTQVSEEQLETQLLFPLKL